MTYYQQLGNIPHKRHTQFRQPSGELYYEELIGAEGFAGKHSLLYHQHPPTAIEAVEAWEPLEQSDTPPGPLHPCHLDTNKTKPGGDAISARVPLLSNADLCISVARPTEPMLYWYRFAAGDEIIFIRSGQGYLESQFGLLHYQPGDYLVIPAGVLWRLLPKEQPVSEQIMLVVEAYGHIRPPKRYRNAQGQFLETAPYCERDIRPPEKLAVYGDRALANPPSTPAEIRVKTRTGITRYFTSHYPMDVVGWAGHLWPYALSIHDFEPITGRVHQPPVVHQTFTGPNFVVCSFVPRLFDYHPQAIPAPYHHANVDSDEVIYYVAGQFMSRRGIAPGSITLHPSGLPHGPQPGRIEASIGQAKTEELAVMVDTFRPLQLTTHATAIEKKDYVYSWRPQPKPSPVGATP